MTLMEWFVAGPAFLAVSSSHVDEARRAYEAALEENKKALDEIVPVRRAFQDTVIEALKEVANEATGRIARMN